MKLLNWRSQHHVRTTMPSNQNHTILWRIRECLRTPVRAMWYSGRQDALGYFLCRQQGLLLDSPALTLA